MNFEEKLSKEGDLEKKKRAYFSNFALKHLTEMRALVKGGVLGKENAEWRNISEHCLVEAAGGNLLAEMLDANQEKVAQALLLHDWYKRKEIEAMQEVGGALGYAKTAEEDSRLLKEFGFPDDIVKLAHSNIPEKADSNYLSGRSPEEKIVHFMDIVTLDTNFSDFRERLELAKQKKHIVEFSDSFREQYQGKSLIELQEEVAKAEEEEFEKKLDLKPGILIYVLKEKLQERINSFSS